MLHSNVPAALEVAPLIGTVGAVSQTVISMPALITGKVVIAIAMASITDPQGIWPDPVRVKVTVPVSLLNGV